MNETDVFYPSLRACGPVPEAAVPDTIANQILAIGNFQGDIRRYKATIALCAMLDCSMEYRNSRPSWTLEASPICGI